MNDGIATQAHMYSFSYIHLIYPWGLDGLTDPELFCLEQLENIIFIDISVIICKYK
jgi:hypothetical protein